MADFAQFGKRAVEMAQACGGNCSTDGVADFLLRQQEAIQAKRIKDRLEGNKAQAPGGQARNPKASDPAVTGEASGAYLRLKALLGQK